MNERNRVAEIQAQVARHEALVAYDRIVRAANTFPDLKDPRIMEAIEHLRAAGKALYAFERNIGQMQAEREAARPIRMVIDGANAHPDTLAAVAASLARRAD
uniref:Helix-turn-helix DNA binding domain protein n=1 Tax=Streptomyces phage Kamino TaxID=3158857 RepID=A0AAU7GYU7_9CAUD